MTCDKCGEKPKKGCGAFPKAVIEIDNPERIVLLRKVLVPASMGDESTFPPTIGKYHNVLLEYEASGGIYLYSSDGIPTKLSSDVTELQAQLNALRVRIGEEEVARADADTALSGRITSLDNSLATVAKTGSYNDLSNKPTIGNGTLTIKKNGSNVGTFTANATTNKVIDISIPTKTSDLTNDGSDGTSTYVEADELSTVATTGSYNDLTNKPTIPTVNNATLTIQKNGTNVQTFTANSSTNKTANITVPTAVSELTNDAGYATTTQLNNGLATKQNTLTAGDNIQINGNTISATDTTYTAGNAIDITNGEISADIHPADFFTAEGVVSDCGNDLSLDGTMASTLKSVELKGGTFQQTYTGKNLLNLTNSSHSGVSGTVNADGTVTISGTATTTTGESIFSSNQTLSAGAYTLTISKALPFLINFTIVSGVRFRLPAGQTSVTVTLSEGYTDGQLFMAMTAGTTYNETFSIQLVSGSTPDYNFEPYVGGSASPNPEYPQDVQVVTGEQTIEVSDGDNQDRSYTVDLGPLELCKIGDYQDYIYKNGSDWYLHKSVKKINLNGAETWQNSGTNTFACSSISDYATSGNAGFSSFAKGIENVTSGTAFSNTAPDQSFAFSDGAIADRLYWKSSNFANANEAKSWLQGNTPDLYYALATPTNTKITDAILVTQLDTLAEAKSYNDQTNIIVTAAGDNLPATLCVETYRKSLSGVIEAIDNACTCRKNLVVYLPNGMTTYENNDAPIPIPEVMEALKRGQSVFLVDARYPERIYVVTAASAEDGIWSMRADQTGINANDNDGYWHINGRDNLWRWVEFVQDTEQDSVINLSVVFDDSSWGTPVSDYSVVNVGGGTTTVGSCNLSAAQGNAGLFVNDDTGVFVTVGEAYELIASGEKVKFNNVPVGQYLTSPHTYGLSGEDVYSGIELPVKYFINVDGAYITDYTNSIAQLRNKGVPPLEVSIRKIDQGDILGYEFTIQGIMPPAN